MRNDEIRALLTVLMYAGVAVFCAPYVLGSWSGLHLYQIVAVMLAVGCGLARCYWSEEECWRHRVRP